MKLARKICLPKTICVKSNTSCHLHILLLQPGQTGGGKWPHFKCLVGMLRSYFPEDAAARTIASCHVGWKWLAVKMTSGRLAMALPRPVHQPLWLSIPCFYAQWNVLHAFLSIWKRRPTTWFLPFSLPFPCWIVSFVNPIEDLTLSGLKKDSIQWRKGQKFVKSRCRPTFSQKNLITADTII